MNSVIFALALLGVAGNAWAQLEHEHVRREVLSGELKPLDDILRDVQSRHAGRVLDIDLERGPAGQRWYEIKLDNGQRTEIYVDAVSGNEIPKPGLKQTQLMSMAAVVRKVQESHPGTVLQVELEDALASSAYYEVQMLMADGRQSLVRADAKTGQVLTAPPIAVSAASRLVPLPPVLELLETRYRARTTEAELKFGRGDRSYYEVELELGNGRSVEIHVDALSGSILDEDRVR